MAEQVSVESRRVGQSLRWYARDRQALLDAPAKVRLSVPASVRETLRAWDVDDRPFYAEVDETGNDVYGFAVVDGRTAPAWWAAAVSAWTAASGGGR